MISIVLIFLTIISATAFVLGTASLFRQAVAGYYLGLAVDRLWQRVAADKPKGSTYMPPTTEEGKVAEIASAYESLKASAVTANAQIAAQQAEIASLTAQIQNGTPATTDQLAALTAIDKLDVEVEADQAAAAPAAPAAASTSASVPTVTTAPTVDPTAAVNPPAGS